MTASVKDTPRTWEKQISSSGAFERKDSVFRDAISTDNDARFVPASGRYHLYVSLACPWAHRTLIARELKGLKEVISVDVVDWLLPKGGWTLRAESEGATLDSVNQKQRLREVYELANPDYSGSITVPVLWDKQGSTIVNNESSEILRFLNSGFQDFARHPEVDLYPAALRSEIDEINEWVYPQINNGVYRAGFARSQQAYEAAAEELFLGLDRAEQILSTRRYLVGKHLTEADIRLFTTLIRFDPVYATHFKCTRRRIVDYPHLWGYLRDLYSHEAFRSTTNMEHIRKHYYLSHQSINPFEVLPLAPELDYEAPHDRERLA